MTFSLTCWFQRATRGPNATLNGTTAVDHGGGEPCDQARGHGELRGAQMQALVVLLTLGGLNARGVIDEPNGGSKAAWKARPRASVSQRNRGAEMRGVHKRERFDNNGSPE